LSSYKRNNPNFPWYEIDRSINRIEKYPPQVSKKKFSKLSPIDNRYFDFIHVVKLA